MSSLPPEFDEWLRPEPTADAASLPVPKTDVADEASASTPASPGTVSPPPPQRSDTVKTSAPNSSDEFSVAGATEVIAASEAARVVPVIPAPAARPVIPNQPTAPRATPDSAARPVIPNQPTAPRTPPVVPAPVVSTGVGQTPPTSIAPTAARPAPPPPLTPAATPRGNPATAPPPSKRRPRRRRHLLRWIAVGMAAYFAAVTAVFALSMNKVDALPAVSSGGGGGKNILMVGSDSRAGLTPEQQAQLTTGAVEGNRTDTIMLMHIPWAGTPTLMSIPRDSWVQIPGYGFDKINAAFALGGPQLLIQTVEQTTGLHVDDFVEIGLAGIANTTDALGGVRLCPTQTYNDELSGLYVDAGCQRMDGPTALAYVRMRYQDPRGDLGRIERQQEFISATVKRALNPVTWILPWRSFGAAHAAGSALTVSKGTGIVDIGRMGVAMGMISVGVGQSTTVPTQEGTFDIAGQNVVLWDEPAAQRLFNDLK